MNSVWLNSHFGCNLWSFFDGSKLPKFFLLLHSKTYIFRLREKLPWFQYDNKPTGKKSRLGVNKIIELGFSTVSFLIWAPSEQQSYYLSQLYLLYTGVTPKIASFHIWAEKSGSFPLMLHFGSFPPSLPRSRVAIHVFRRLARNPSSHSNLLLWHIQLGG